jgi:hypothetical protein
MFFALLLIAFVVCLVGVSAKRTNEAQAVKRQARRVDISRNAGRSKRRA